MTGYSSAQAHEHPQERVHMCVLTRTDTCTHTHTHLLSNDQPLLFIRERPEIQNTPRLAVELLPHASGSGGENNPQTRQGQVFEDEIFEICFDVGGLRVRVTISISLINLELKF